MIRISIIGTGYVGLVTGACLALNKDNHVTCLDKNKKNIKYILENKKSPFYEKGLDLVIRKGLESKNLVFSHQMKDHIKNSDVTFIAVGTPSKRNGIDLKQIEKASLLIGEALKKKKRFHVIVVKSTVEPSTTESFVKKIIIKKSENKKITFCMNPEFLRQGFAVNDFLNPDRIIIGCESEQTKNLMKKIYKHLESKFFYTNIINAELAKYTSNIFLANAISFSNELSNICENIQGSDISSILETLSFDRRFATKVGKKLIMPEILNYIQAGIGFGGSCLPKDVLALKNYAKRNKVKTPMIDSIISINKDRAIIFVDKISKTIGKLRKKKIAVIGMSFKPETDDLRDSPAIKVIDKLIMLGAHVYTWDPLVKKENIPSRIKNKISHSSNLAETCKNKDCILLTHKSEYIKNYNWNKFGKISIFDGRNTLKRSKLKNNIKYFPIGKGKI